MLKKLTAKLLTKKSKYCVIVLAAIIVFTTTYALILPAITIDEQQATEENGFFLEAETSNLVSSDGPIDSAITPDATQILETETISETPDIAAQETPAQEEAVPAEQAPVQAEESQPLPDPKTEQGIIEQPIVTASFPAMTFEATLKKSGETVMADSISVNEDGTVKVTAKDEQSQEKALEELQKNEFRIKAEAEEGSFPEGTTMKVEEISKVASVQDAVRKAIDESSRGIKIFQSVNITFYDKDGNEIQPLKDIKVTFISNAIKEEKQSSDKGPIIVHLKDDGTNEVVPKIDDWKLPEKPAEDELTIETGHFSIYVIVGTTIEKTVLASDGHNYRITATYGPEAGIPDDAELSVEEIVNNTPDYYKYEIKSETALGMEPRTSEYVRLFDIKLVDKYDPTIKYQPAEGTSVAVKIELADAQSNSLSVVHFADEADSGIIVDNAETNGQTVEFLADGFSVYAVVDESVDANARMTLEFYSKGTKIATMYVKNGDTAAELEYILYDPGAGSLSSGELFIGWIQDKENGDYTTADVGDAMTIDQVRAWAESHPITEGETHRFDAAIGKLYHITYKDTDGTVLGMDAVPVKADQYGVDAVEATVKMAYTPKDDVHNFEGWKLDTESDSKVTSTIPGDRLYQNDSKITIKGDISFTVNAPEGAWLIFDENGKGGKYNAPQFVKSGETTEPPCPDSEMTRNGYTFGGWYDTKEHADAHGANPSVTTGRVTFGSTIHEKKTVYASWIPNERAPYTVILWGQNADRTAYEVVGSYVGTGRVGQNIPYTVVENGDEDYVTGVGTDNGHYTGFSVKDSDKNQQITIRPEGDAVLNLHYDRITYNMRVYLYRKGNGNNSYQYAQNSNAGKNVWNIATWYTGTSLNNMPTTTYPGGIHSDTVDGYTGYYILLSAYYGEDISSKWPQYSQISSPANNRSPVSFVMMNGTGLKGNGLNDNGYGTGRDTIKGLITTMDEKILGKTNDANGNYLIVRFNTYNNWRYHIWYETVDGEDYTGKTTHTWNGKTYYEADVLEVRSSNTDVGQQNPPQYIGYENIGRRNQNWNGNDRWTTGNNPTLYHINYVYDRLKYKIEYFDGTYFDGKDNVVQNRATNLLHESSPIAHGTLIPAADRNYIPTLPAGEQGYVFEGWYLDEGCTTPYTWGTMPIGGIKVYAKWRKQEYRVFLHPNAGTDPSLSWGSENVSTSFRVAYGGKVSTPTGTRPNSGYEFVGWYTDPSMSSQYLYNADTELNDETVTTPYNKTEPTERDKWGNPTEPGNNDSNRFWITRKLDLYAKWRKILEGAEGIKVTYTADDGKGHSGTNAPTDDSEYPDQADATAQAADTAPAGMHFKHWVIQKWDETANNGAGGYVDTALTVLPGEKFTVDEGLAHKEPKADQPGEYTYTMRLRAEYSEPESELPTHIWWFKNYSDTGAERHDSFHQDEGIQINESVGIQAPLTREGYTFLGWARVTTGTSDSTVGTPPTGKVLELDEDDLFLKYENGHFVLNDSTSAYNGRTVTKVAADERQQYHDMYAVWKQNTYTVTIKKVVQNGTAEDEQKGFTINYDFDLTSLTDGSVTLKHNQTSAESALASVEVPYGTVITVSESVEDYAASYSAERTTDTDGSALTSAEAVAPEEGSSNAFKVIGDTTITVTNTPQKLPVAIYKTGIGEDETITTGATFVLYKASEYNDSTQTANPDATIVAQGTTNENGILILGKLAIGEYRLVETVAPAGYNYPDQAMKIIVNSSGVSGFQGNVAMNVKNAESFADITDKTTVVLRVWNNPGVSLPSTGGPGAFWFYILGGVVALGAGILLIVRRRRA